MLKNSNSSAEVTLSSRTKWLWLAALALLVVVAATIVFMSSPTRRPSAIHYVAAQFGVFVGYSFFAVLLAAGIKLILKARWVWHDWANAIIFLTAGIFALRHFGTDATDVRRLPAELSAAVESSPPSNTKDDARVSNIVGSWKCKAESTGASFVITYDTGGRMVIATLGSLDAVADSPIFWDIEDGNLLVQRYADGQRFTKSRITRLTANTFVTVASNGSVVSCDQISAKRRS